MADKKEISKGENTPKFNQKGLDTIAGLYTTLIDAGRSSNVLAFMGGLAIVDLLHSAGLLKDSMYSRIGTFADVAFTTEQIGGILTNSASALKTLAEAERESMGSIVDILKALPPGTLAKMGLLESANASQEIGS